MGEEVQEVNPACIEVNGTDEPELVSGDVEDNHGLLALDLHKIGVREIAAHFGERFPFGVASDLGPMEQGRSGGAVCLGPFDERRCFDESHGGEQSRTMGTRGASLRRGWRGNWQVDVRHRIQGFALGFALDVGVVR